MLTPEELLKPRYKVIADYPGSPFYVNSILDIQVTTQGEAVHEWYDSEGKNIMYQTQLDEMPYLFKLLEWWEERELADFSELKYVTWVPGMWPDPEVYKISGVEFDRIGLKGVVIDKGTMPHAFYKNYKFLPATEEEYSTYINKKD